MEKLRNIIKEYYLGNADPYEVGDEYFKLKLYSAATAFYMAELAKIHDSGWDDLKKSYCLTKIGESYLEQGYENQFSGWQLDTIKEMFKSAITYNPNNYKAYIGLINALKEEQDKKKTVYHLCKYFIYNLLDNVIEEDINNVIDIIYTLYETGEFHFIIEYKSTEKRIFDFISRYIDKINREDYYKILTIMQENHTKLDDFDKVIFDKTF